MNMKLKIGAFHLILNINRKKYSASKYTDLAPVDNADKDGNYCQAIDYAINNLITTMIQPFRTTLKGFCSGGLNHGQKQGSISKKHEHSYLYSALWR